MSDELKWWEIERAVWERGPAEKSQRAVLAQLAKHADAQGITFVGQRKVIALTKFSESTVKRAIAALEFAGWIRVEERAVLVETPRGFERKGNRYVLNLVKLHLADAPAAQKQKTSGVEGCGPAGRRNEGKSPTPAASDGEGCGPVAEKRHIGWSSDEGSGPAASAAKPRAAACNAVETQSARSHFEGGEVSLEARRGVIRGAPLINNSYLQKRTEEPPYAPPLPSTGCESSEKQRQKQRLPDQGGGSAKVVVFPKRQRQPREPREAVRSMQWDGEEAALWAETERVLVGCGVVPKNAGRKLREAISLALEQQWRNSDLSLESWGTAAIDMWALYVSLGLRLRVRCGLMQFFKSGEWLHSGRWRYDAQELDRRRRGPG